MVAVKARTCEGCGKAKGCIPIAGAYWHLQCWQKSKRDVKPRRHKLPAGECPTCDRERAANTDFHPSHDASPRCESGKHSHCSCDTCF